LDFCVEDNVLDAGGGRSGYIEMVGQLYGCQNLYLTDHIYEGTIPSKSRGEVKVTAGDISNIGFPDSEMSKIACHHAFEHFKDDKDISFINETARLLKKGGRACIIPVFVVDRYVECWNIESAVPYDKKASLITDTSATLPGADEDGHFARLYDVPALNDRVLATALDVGLTPSISVCKID
jgi:predicted SAM-dependent methyltransferase